MEYFGVALEDAGGLSTKEVSVVLVKYSISLALGGAESNSHKRCLAIEIAAVIFL